MATFVFKQLKKIDAKTRKITFGYVHNMQELLPCDIPDAVFYIILYYMSEYFPFIDYNEIQITKNIPDFDKIKTERAIKHSCHVKIIDDGQQLQIKEEWTKDMRLIKIANNPYTNGCLSFVYYMQDTTDMNITETNNTPTHVAKIKIDPLQKFETYFEDVSMQCIAQRFAYKYNMKQVPKKIVLLMCWVYELVDTIPHKFYLVEQYIPVEYFKYTNSWDWVNQAIDRNTPSAFAHFTYYKSKQKLLICDLQKVNDLYTDAQIHTHDGEKYGLGNMGRKDIEKFVTCHKCNAICAYLKLPRIGKINMNDGIYNENIEYNVNKILLCENRNIEDVNGYNTLNSGISNNQEKLIPHDFA
eukprot:469870_1